MPNPKRRHSQQRSAKRRTHYKATAETWSVDAVTGETHLRHRAHWAVSYTHLDVYKRQY